MPASVNILACLVKSFCSSVKPEGSATNCSFGFYRKNGCGSSVESAMGARVRAIPDRSNITCGFVPGGFSNVRMFWWLNLKLLTI